MLKICHSYLKWHFRMPFNRFHGQRSLSVNQKLSTSSNNINELTAVRPYEEMPRVGAFSFVRKASFSEKKHELQDLLFDLSDQYGTIYRLPAIFGKPAVVVTINPKDIECVFRNEGKWPERPGSEAIHWHRTKHRADFFKGIVGLASSKGADWGNFRTTVNPVLMQPATVRLYYKKMSEVNQQFVERIRQIRDSTSSEVPADFEDEINRWTLESIALVALDTQLGLITTNRDDPKAKKLFSALKEFFRYGADVEMGPSLWRYVRTPLFKKYINALDVIVDTTSSYVQESIDRLELESKKGEQSEQSVLAILRKIDTHTAMVMATDLLTAGVDTTTAAFTAVMLSLARNTDKQAKLREELVSKVLPTKNAEFTLESLDNMPYMRACIKEALRFYPITFGNARIIQRDLVLSGFHVPKGEQVFMMSSKLYRNEKYYPQSNEFIPERFLRDTDEFPLANKTSSPFLNLPFGFGTRMCIGKRIVEMELELGIARIIRNFNVEFNHSTEKAFKNLLINVPNIPLKFKFTDVLY